MSRWLAPPLLAGVLVAAPAAASAHLLTMEIRNGSHPLSLAACTVQFEADLFTVVEVQGTGKPFHGQMRWPAFRDDEEVLLRALAALISEELPRLDVTARAPPEPPYVYVSYIAGSTGGLIAGHYLQTHLELPDPLARVVETFFAGGPCGAALPPKVRPGAPEP